MHTIIENLNRSDLIASIFVIATVGRKFNAVARVMMMAAMVAAVVGYNVLTTSAVTENNREHTATARHKVYGKDK